MERWRWLPQDLGPFYVNVNIPEFVVASSRTAKIHETRVVVGKTNKQTPIINDEMEEIVFRPNWYVPNSIKTEEIAPYLHRGGGFFGGGQDTSIFRRQDLRIRGVNGRDIDPDSIDWGRTDIRRYELYQPPGPRNVLGLVKFRFRTPMTFICTTRRRSICLPRRSAPRVMAACACKIPIGSPRFCSTMIKVGQPRRWTRP